MQNVVLTANDDGTIDLECNQGTTWKLKTYLYTDSSYTTPKDMTGYSARGHVKQTYSDLVNTADFDCSVVITDPVTGEGYVESEIGAALSALISYTGIRYMYVIDIYIGSPEDVTRIMRGKIRVNPQ